MTRCIVRRLLFLTFIFLPSIVMGETVISRPYPTLEEMDGSPSIRYPKIQVPNGSLSDSGTTAILTFGTVSGNYDSIWERIDSNTIRLRQSPIGSNAFWTVTGDNVTFTQVLWWQNRESLDDIILK